MSDNLLDKIKAAEEEAQLKVVKARERLEKDLKERKSFWQEKERGLEEEHQRKIKALAKTLEPELKEIDRQLLAQHKEKMTKIKERAENNLARLEKEIFEKLGLKTEGYDFRGEQNSNHRSQEEGRARLGEAPAAW